ncbi:SWIM zinc finger family protein [Streptomyces sp. NPDC005263]|uniref:SWIM zinc finger family protein n=1 Tax=Streptomyces sp. NPDC005263 TaxID=3364711 RepID=UPI00367A1EB6
MPCQPISPGGWAEPAGSVAPGRPVGPGSPAGSVGSGGHSAPGEPSSSRVRPGDAARAALRQAVSARRAGAPAAEEHPAAKDAAGRAADGTASTAKSHTATSETPEAREAPEVEAEAEGSRRRDARPADVAREALRAARKGARQAQGDAMPSEGNAAGPKGETARRPGQTSATGRSSSGPARHTAEQRARDVRVLLADAFKMPDTAASSEVDSDGDRRAEQASSSAGSPTPGAFRVSDTVPPPEVGGGALRTPQPNPPAGTPAPDPTPRNTDTALTSRTPAPAPSPTSTASSPTPAAPPRHPRSMAAPDRDSELRRTFPAFPSRPSDSAGFAETWWGNAWVAALEEGALDAKRLARGRAYAEQGNVDAITVTPGLVLAYVQGSRARPYRVQVRLRTLDDTDWDSFLNRAAERPGDIAALLDKEMPHTLVDSGVPLLPGPGDLDPLCSCPDSGHPCKHAAALCYQTARLLDADPFVLLLLRGRGERGLLDALSRLSAARAARAAQEQGPAPVPGVRATEALAPRLLPPLPTPSPVPPHPGQPPVYPATAGGPDPLALDQLATDAAARAHALLATGRDPVGELTLWQDAVRLAAARPGSGLTAGTRSLYSSLATAAGRTPADLARAVAAWRQGGLEGLSVLEETWDPPAGRFDRARPLLLAADLPPFRPWHNHLTHPRGHVQLRLGRDGLWYAYESEPGHEDWWPRGTPDLDPVGALTGLGAPGEL